MTDVLAVICANGLGHFRRTIGILDRLCSAEPALTMTIAAEPWQWEQTRTWAAAAHVRARARHVAGITMPGVTWRRSAADYVDGRLLTWEARLGALDGLDAARLVLSDNLGGTLAARPDTVLLGSFLWSDVLASAYPDHPQVSAFVAHERALLAALRPPMICVERIAMPGVLARTQATGVPWMCEHVAAPRRTRAAQPRVVLAGGATGAADALLDAAEAELRGVLGGVEVTRGAPLSSGGELDLSATDVLVTRPGIGTVTAAIAARVPMVLVHEAGNLELAHNAKTLERLGLGLDAGEDASPGAVVDAVARLLDPIVWAQTIDALASEPTDGLDRAVAWLRDRLAR